MRSLQHPESITGLVAEQSRVIGALMMREIYTRFGRDNIGFMWIIVEPAMFCLGVVGLWSVMKHSGHEEAAIIPFVITGYMPLLMFRHMTSKLMRCMQANSALLYHRQIKIFSLYMARILVEFLGTTAAFFIVMLGFLTVGAIDPPTDISLMLQGWLLYTWFTAGFSMVVGALAERSEIVEKIWNPLSYITIPMSGTFYMLYWMPDRFREILTWMPQVNGVEMIRGGYFGAGVPTFFDPVYLAFCSALMTAAGLYFVATSRRHLEID